MKKFKAFARRFLFTRIIIFVVTLVIFNIVLCYFDSEALTKQCILIISIILILSIIIAIIFYPKFMNMRFHLLRYDDYLYCAINTYQESLKIIEKNISNIKDADIKQFIIGKEKSSKYDALKRTKLFENARVNKESILKDYQKDFEKTEKKLKFCQTEKEECAKLLFAYGVYRI